MDEPGTYIVTFPGLDAAEAAQAAEDLRRTLLELDPAIRSRRVRTDPDAMDFGSAIEVLAGASSVTALVQGLTGFLGRRASSKVTIKRRDGTVIVENISRHQAVALAEKFLAADAQR